MFIAGANTAWIIRNSPAWIQEACFLLSQDVGWTLCCISCFNFLVKIQVESQILIGTYHLMKALIWKDTGGREGNLGKVSAKFWRNFVTIGRTFLLKLEIETKFPLNEVIFISWGKCPWGIFHTSQYWFSSISILFFFGCFAFLLLKIDFFFSYNAFWLSFTPPLLLTAPSHFFFTPDPHFYPSSKRTEF